VFVLLVLATFRVQGAALLVVIVGVAAMNIVLGLWPTWAIIILAVMAGVMVWREVGSGSAS